MANAASENNAIDERLLDILRCPVALQQGANTDARLHLHCASWLICDASGMKYPIREGIPVMLVAEAQKWQKVAVADLPVPPPEE